MRRAVVEPARILAVAAAVPPYVIDQPAAAAGARHIFADRHRQFDRFAAAFTHAGIETRHSCVPIEWYFLTHGWPERMKLFTAWALALIEQAARDACKAAAIDPEEIDAVICVQSTGIATPSLDARLIGRLGMRPDVMRLPIFGLGCAGGLLGLERAATLARDKPGRLVLMVAVELCGLTFRRQDLTKSNVIATALFGDGAAAVLIRTGEVGTAIGPAAEHCFPDSMDVMGWEVADDGLGVIFSRDIPTLVERDFRPILLEFLRRNDLTLADLDGVVCHPGGTKVLEALERALEQPQAAMADARNVLRQYGNMSSVTVLFVLAEALRRGAQGRHLLTALGPGFTAAMGLLDLAPDATPVSQPTKVAAA